ncbi:MAG: molybdopterin dinucleotide binding domain-containing protein [Pirellulaceae bacterium]
MPVQRLQLHPIRTAKQGVEVNVGKESDDYKSIVTTLSIHESDMLALGVANGDRVRVTTAHGAAEFVCEQAKVPEGMIFVPYGPPTCRLMGGDTGGTGMPTSKGWDVDVEPVASADTID